MITTSIEKLLSEALSIEEISAQEAGELGFMARSMTLCTLPHSKPKDNEFTRRNGNYTLTMISPRDIGLPYGSVPRLLLAWMATEAVRTKERVLVLGDTLSHFMRELGLTPTGGKKGDITRLREQMKRLFSSSISCLYHDEKRDAGVGFRIAKGFDLWWHPQQPEQAGLWQSTITLSEEFYEEILSAPIPIDIRALKALKRSPMALDLYMWLTFRNSYLKKETMIMWEQLQLQFGADYNRTDNFKSKFNEALRKVSIIYPEAKIQPTERGLLIAPSKPHITKHSKNLLTK